MTKEKTVSENSAPGPVMGNYARLPITLARGKGSEVFDDNGRRLLDFLGGISVCCLGHCPDRVAAALKRQLDRLWHVSNLYRIKEQEMLAARLVDLSFADQVFFCNSGTEAIEAALKLARLASAKISGRPRPVFVAMKQSFHGRTMGSLSVTGQAVYQDPFKPLLPDVRFCDFGSVESLDKALDDTVAAVILEPMQAEGGLIVPPDGYLKEVRRLCDERNVLLIFDEVQVGVGRLGTLFAYQKWGVEPDIMALAKGLAAGFPIGAMLARWKASRHLGPGTHASTFGGNPLASVAALEVLDIVGAPAFLTELQGKIAMLRRRLEAIVSKCPAASERRGMGMLQGIRFDRPVAPLVERLQEKGLLAGKAGPEVLRLAPALNIPDGLLEEGMDIVESCVTEVM